MAKEDFCFTYYDGDAARDKAHMTRLCRGAYDDLISMQRKAGHLDMEAIKMVLSSDFEACWPALKFILKQDEEQKFFIEWVDTSIKKSAAHSKKQRDKIVEYWEKKKKEKDSVDYTGEIPGNNNGNSEDIPLKEKPLENENENEKGSLNFKGGPGEKAETVNILIVPELASVWMTGRPDYILTPDADFTPLREIADNIAKLKNIPRISAFEDVTEIKNSFEKICDWLLKTDTHFKDFQLSQVSKYFNGIVSAMKGKPQEQGKGIIQKNVSASQQAAAMISKKYEQV